MVIMTILAAEKTHMTIQVNKETLQDAIYFLMVLKK